MTHFYSLLVLFFQNILSVANWYLFGLRDLSWWIIHYHLNPVHKLHGGDPQQRVDFSWISRFPDWRVIEAAYDRQRNGNIMPRRGMNGGHPITKRTQGQERRVLNLFRRDPCTSSRVVARETNMSCRTVNRITRSITSIRCTSYTEEILSSAWISRSFSWQSFGEILVCFSV